MEPLAERSGLVVNVDSVRLTRAFLAWSQDFTRQRAAALDRRDYIVFTAEMLLMRLLENKAVEVISCTPPASLGEHVREIIDFWPEGFLFTEYCLNVLQAVLRQEFGETPQATVSVSPLASDLRVWWSYRENVTEDVATAIGFFDLFVGGEPNWRALTFAAQRPAMMRAAQLTASRVRSEDGKSGPQTK